jgi:signal peptidase I
LTAGRGSESGDDHQRIAHVLGPETADTAPDGPLHWRPVLGLVQALAIAVVVSVVLNLFVVQVTEVRQLSMEPTLLQADRVLVSKVDYRLGSPQRGDIVVFNPTGAGTDVGIPFVKRVVAVAGDVVDLRDGQLLVNGVPADFPEAHGPTVPENPAYQSPLTVPEGSFFALGDNRLSSSDSRQFGPQAMREIIGKVVARFWPLDRVRFFAW